jgi:23S rRNA maturation-related 3'-5' exoribonuclease YhaM
MEFNKHYTWLTLQPWFKDNDNINPDNIIHNILSHHGKREYGSPVSPATKEAWILHQADNLSARLDDCDKHDIINH